VRVTFNDVEADLGDEPPPRQKHSFGIYGACYKMKLHKHDEIFLTGTLALHCPGLFSWLENAARMMEGNLTSHTGQAPVFGGVLAWEVSL
jgi:hypothetical protein